SPWAPRAPRRCSRAGSAGASRARPVRTSAERSASVPADADQEAWAELFGLAAPEEEDEEERPRRGLWARLRDNMTRPRQAISPQLAGVFAPRLLTAETWERLEEALISADCGADVALELVERLRAQAAEGRIVDGASLADALRREVVSEMGAEPP